MSLIVSTILGIMVFCGLGYGGYTLITWLMSHVPPDLTWAFWANLVVIMVTIGPIITVSILLGSLCYAFMEEDL